jgi:hypothetical protein
MYGHWLTIILENELFSSVEIFTITQIIHLTQLRYLVDPYLVTRITQFTAFTDSNVDNNFSEVRDRISEFVDDSNSLPS